MNTTPIQNRLTVAFAHPTSRAVRMDAVYDPRDPYAVHLHIPPPSGGRPMVLTFARTLLLRGLDWTLRSPIGEGAITIGPAEAHDYVEITDNAYGPQPVRFYANRDELTRFATQTYKKVPDQREDDWIAWDTAWMWLHRCVLGGAA